MLFSLKIQGEISYVIVLHIGATKEKNRKEKEGAEMLFARAELNMSQMQIKSSF